MSPRLEEMRDKGGRAYALSARAMTHIAVFTYAYTAWLIGATLFGGLTIEQYLLVPIIVGISTMAALGGAPTLPNIAERWGGRPAQPPPRETGTEAQ